MSIISMQFASCTQTRSPGVRPVDERRGHAVAALVDLAEGVFFALPFEADLVAAIYQRQVEKIAKILLGGAAGYHLFSISSAVRPRELSTSLVCSPMPGGI